MLLIILALFWVALLAPVAIRRLRDGGAERSIQSFHAEHEVLSRQEYAVAPLTASIEPDEDVIRASDDASRPRLDGRSRRRHLPHHSSRAVSWDEWSRGLRRSTTSAERARVDESLRARVLLGAQRTEVHRERYERADSSSYDEVSVDR